MSRAPDLAKKAHRLVLQVNTNDQAMMNLALNNATNVEQHYKELGQKVEIEIVTFGPGLHMLRDDTSPVKDRIKAIAEKSPAISFKACGNTQENMNKAENKAIPLVSQATLVKSGVVRVMELQEQGWSLRAALTQSTPVSSRHVRATPARGLSRCAASSVA